ELPVDDLSGLDGAGREAEALRRSGEESWRPFDLARGPLLRLRLYRLGAEEHLLAVTTHHIVSDGWSVGVMVREVGALYEAFASGCARGRSPGRSPAGSARWGGARVPRSS